MTESSQRVAIYISNEILRNNPFRKNETVFNYLKKLNIEILFEPSNNKKKWEYIKNNENRYIIMNYPQDLIGAYKVNYEILEAFISTLYSSKNFDFKEVSNYVICSLVFSSSDLDIELLKVFKEGLYNTYDLQHVYKLPPDKIKWYLKEIKYI